jgi:phosphoribosylaminoimidazole carboxylase PurE protein
MDKPIVSIIMGSDSDLVCMKDAAKVMSSFEIPYEITIVSAHRTPKRLYDYATNVENRGIKCIIAGAGGAAHLPGMVASITPLPVIGVPIKTSSLSGNDSLLSIVQMPKGIPVATVAINNSTNAALLACRILSIGDDTLIEKMKTFMKEQADTVITKAEKLEKCGYDEYIKGTL